MTDSNDRTPAPDEGPKGDASVPILTGQQSALHEELAKLDELRPHKDMLLAQMYRGAILTLDQANNPDRLAQAAHSVRELMEKLPRVMDVPMLHDAGLSERAVVISKKWRSFQVSADGPEKTAELASFHVTMEEFTVWIENRARNRTEIAEQFLDKLDPRKTGLPGPIKDLHVSVWKVCHKYFEGVAHHNFRTTIEAFAGYLDEVERFLLERLRPRTFNDQAALKAIIEEGEANAES